MKNRILFFLVFCFISNAAFAQLIWTDPVFPRVDDAVTVYFDATQGTGGLAGCNCDVYVHTGVITTASNGSWTNVPTQWGVANAAWKMTPVSGQPDVYSYQITPSVRQYYSIIAGDIVEQLAFVFRNSDGTREGKDVGNADIFYPIYPDNLPFSGILLAPTSNALVKQIGETVSVQYAVSESSTITLTDNGTQLTQVTGLSLNYTIPVNTSGTHEVVITANNGSSVLSTSFSYVVPLPVVQAPLPANTQLGSNWINNEEGVILALYAPNKQNVFLLGDFNDWQLNTDFQLKRTPDGTTWWIQIDGLTLGDTYRYQYLVDGDIKIADPNSHLVLDNFNDPYITPETYPDLPAYPDGKTTGIVTVIQPGAPDYQWLNLNFQRPDKHKMVVYELLIRDFVDRHDYTTLIDSLGYLVNLGVNAIELMPVCEFEGNISWGYNPSFHSALDKYYGTANEFKRFIDACHEKGIAVILDVVYNHAFGQNPMVQLYFDGKPTAENPWFNRDATHPYNVGFDFNHESPATKIYVENSLRYWLQEFHVDGFRFDLSKGFTQVNNPNDVNAWGQYDASRIAILKNYSDVVWDQSPGAYAIMEHFAVNQEEKELIEYGMLVWNNLNGRYSEASKGFASNDLGGTSYKSRGWTIPGIVSYMESHDEERLMVRNLQSGNSDAGSFYNVRTPWIALRRQELVSAFFYSFPGPKMLWMFGELGYDVSIDFDGRTGPKPIRWQYLEEGARRRLHDLTGAMISLRNNYDIFHTTDFTTKVGAAIFGKTIHLNSTDMNVVVLGDFNVIPANVNPEFQHAGTWYEYFSGDSLEVSNLTQPIELQAGEYRLYSDVKLPAPPAGYLLTTGLQDLYVADYQLSVMPNPARSQALIQYELEKAGPVTVQLFAVDGKCIRTLVNEKQAAGTQSVQLNDDLSPGLYFVVLMTDQGYATEKLVVEK